MSNIKQNKVKDMENKSENQKLTLEVYYKALKRPPFPKKEFILGISRDCGVDPITVRNWIYGKNLPNNPEHKEYLSQITGIPVDQLWNR